MKDGWLNKVNWAQDGLVPAVAQDAQTGRVLTVAWMNREALQKTVQTGGIACHTGRYSCFFQKLEGGEWVVSDPVLKDPKDIYKGSSP